MLVESHGYVQDPHSSNNQDAYSVAQDKDLQSINIFIVSSRMMQQKLKQSKISLAYSSKDFYTRLK